MTIRYVCTTCSSVLKIKEEKAGTEGKCPKCKSVFTIPSPDADDDPAISLDDESSDSADTPAPDFGGADDVDVPIDLTPEVRSDDNFDPMDVLSSSGPVPTTGRSSSGAYPVAPAGAGSTSGAPKPSIAELMKDFEAGKKKDKEKKAEAPKAASPSPAQTTGSAADALSRAYQQKRDTNTAPKTVKNEREEEERRLRNEFMKRASVVLAGIAVFVVFFMMWMNREAYTGPPLYDVTGKITRRGAAVPGLTVLLVPVENGITQEEPRNTARGTTDLDGNFIMMYTGSFAGAPLGNYRLQINDLSGMPMPIPDEHSEKLVTEDKNEIVIDLQ